MNGVSWIKLSVDLFSHPKIKFLFRLPYGDKAVLLWVFILTSAGQCNDNGKVYLANGVPFSSFDLSIELKCEESVVDSILNDFVKLKMVSIDKNGVITVSNWDKYQSVDRLAELREYNRLAKQRERERKGSIIKENVIDKSLTSQCREDKKRKDKKISPKSPKSSSNEYESFVDELIKKGQE